VYVLIPTLKSNLCTDQEELMSRNLNTISDGEFGAQTFDFAAVFMGRSVAARTEDGMGFNSIQGFRLVGASSKAKGI
jgi:hypothetical protein